MNWRRGLFRAWAMISAMWIALWAALSYLHLYELFDTGSPRAWPRVWDTVATMTIPPLILLGLGLAAFWVVRGFQAGPAKPPTGS